MTQSLSQKLAPFVAACCTGIWVETCEPKEADEEIRNLCGQANWRHAYWDIDSGFSGVIDAEANNPIKAIKAIANIDNPADKKGQRTPLLVVLPNFHRYLNAPGFELIQVMINQLIRGRQQNVYLIVLSPVTQIPVELEKMVSIIDHPLPDQEQLRQILTSLKKPLPDEKEVEKILDAAAGFTRQQAEDAFACSWTNHQKFEADSIWEIKADMLRDSSALSSGVFYHRQSEAHQKFFLPIDTPAWKYDRIRFLDSLKGEKQENVQVLLADKLQVHCKSTFD